MDTASFTPPTTSPGTVYYYVKVTNSIKDNGDTGSKAATTTSGTVKVIVPGIKVNYTDSTSEVVVYDPTTSKIPFTRRDNTLITSVEINGKPPYLVGRKADTSDLKMKFDGSGSLEFRSADGGYVPIGSYAEFQLISTNNTGKYRQEADLNLMNQEWTPIAVGSNGEFNGGGKEIANLKINKPDQDIIGLFSRNNGTIQNVHIASGAIEGRINTGGICGENSGIITDCSNGAAITGTGMSYFVGGVAGSNNGSNAKITACYNTGTVKNFFTNTGGVTGHNSNSATITACYNTGGVQGTENIGGVAGTNDSSATITACYNTSTVQGTGNTGGVAGSNYSTIIACYS